jgi:hypothetical protein
MLIPTKRTSGNRAFILIAIVAPRFNKWSVIGCWELITYLDGSPPETREANGGRDVRKTTQRLWPNAMLPASSGAESLTSRRISFYLIRRSPLKRFRTVYPAITTSFSAGIFAIKSGGRFRCEVTNSGGKRLSQLFKETSTN